MHIKPHYLCEDGVSVMCCKHLLMRRPGACRAVNKTFTTSPPYTRRHTMKPGVGQAERRVVTHETDRDSPDMMENMTASLSPPFSAAPAPQNCCR